MEHNTHMQPLTLKNTDGENVNVLEVIGSSGLGGMENYIKSFVEHLPKQFQVTCICPHESPFTNSLRKLGVKDIFITPISDDPEWRSIQLAIEVARLNNIDIMHAHMPKAHVLAGLAGCLLNKPVVSTIHGMNVTSHELGITRAVGSYLIANCQEAYTQALAMGVSPERVNLVRNGVDTTIFKPNNSGDKFRKEIKVPEGTPLVGFAGRLEFEKGPDLFIRAAEYIHHRKPEVHFVLMGDGFMGQRLKDMCTQMRLEEHVHFCGWCENTQDTYPALDLLVHTSRSDGTSLVLLEAMACGCPTIGMAVGGVREVIESETTGFVVGAGDWEAVGIRTLQLLDQPARLESMRVAARKRVEEHFSVGTNTRLTAEILRNIAFNPTKNYRSTGHSLSMELGSVGSLDVRGSR